MKQALATMLELQDSMNAKVHPDWRNQGNAWYRAIWVECAELLDHYGWKWWKAQSPDMEQVELELIDIWHFGLSILLESAVSGDYEGIVDELGLELIKPCSVELDPEAFRAALEHFAHSTLASKSFDVQGFTRLMAHVEMSFEQLFRRYIAKNVLNIFRQDNGYKEGTYRKIWADKEDNEHLMELLAQLDQSEITKDSLYAALDTRYKQSA